MELIDSLLIRHLEVASPECCLVASPECCLVASPECCLFASPETKTEIEQLLRMNVSPPDYQDQSRLIVADVRLMAP